MTDEVTKDVVETAVRAFPWKRVLAALVTALTIGVGSGYSVADGSNIPKTAIAAHEKRLDACEAKNERILERVNSIEGKVDWIVGYLKGRKDGP